MTTLAVGIKQFLVALWNFPGIGAYTAILSFETMEASVSQSVFHRTHFHRRLIRIF